MLGLIGLLQFFAAVQISSEDGPSLQYFAKCGSVAQGLLKFLAYYVVVVDFLLQLVLEVSHLNIPNYKYESKIS